MTIKKSPERSSAARNPLLVHRREYFVQGQICLATRARIRSAYFSRTEQLPPRGFGSLDPSSRHRCTHLMAELTLMSNNSAASRRDAPASTVPITRSRRSPEYDCGIVGPPTGESMPIDSLISTAKGIPLFPSIQNSTESAIIATSAAAQVPHDCPRHPKARHKTV